MIVTFSNLAPPSTLSLILFPHPYSSPTPNFIPFTQVVEQLEQTDQRKNAEVIVVMLENIKLRNRVRRSETLLRQKEELADGLHLIDFEQLKIENQTFNEKIEERNEEVTKLKKKITTIVQMLSHLKEKLAFTQEDNGKLRGQLNEIDQDVAVYRDDLPNIKTSRDRMRKNNATLQHKNGLRGSKMLLRDFEKKVVGPKNEIGPSNDFRINRMNCKASWTCYETATPS